jgi:hippurate hydrolase
MKRITPVCSLLCLLAAPGLAAAQEIGALVNSQLSGLVDTYKGIHAHPELSHHEEHTAALLAGELRKADDVHVTTMLRTGVTAMSSVAIALLQ